MTPASARAAKGRARRRRPLLRFVTVCLLLLAAASALAPSSAAAQQAVVRGRLQRVTPAGLFPAVGLVVTIRAANLPDAPRSLPVYSGYDGMYYFYGVPPGVYVLEVWMPNTPQPFIAQPVAINYIVGPYGYMCDIPPFNVP